MSFTYQSYANLPYWGCLPCGMTNYGGDTQVFTIPDYVGSQINMNLNPWAIYNLCNQSTIVDNWAYGGYNYSLYGPSIFGGGFMGYYC